MKLNDERKRELHNSLVKYLAQNEYHRLNTLGPAKDWEDLEVKSIKSYQFSARFHNLVQSKANELLHIIIDVVETEEGAEEDDLYQE